MLTEMLKSKIHRATVTEANIHYKGSITIDADLLEASSIVEYEKVQVVDLSNGARLETYVISGLAGSRMICMNGAAAKLIQKGDMVIILSYVLVEKKELTSFNPKIVYVDESNGITHVEDYSEQREEC